jgi:hypothetical protein
MRFMMLYKPGFESDAPPTADDLAKMGAFIEEHRKSGVLVATDGLHPSKSGARVRISGGTFTITDGPFAETKELIAGYAIVDVTSKDEAIELSKRFLSIVGQGESEIRVMQHAPGR